VQKYKKSFINYIMKVFSFFAILSLYKETLLML
jgi:hypothetical protein